MIFVGYMPNGYVFYDPIGRKEYLSRDAKFYESVGAICIKTSDGDKFQDAIDRVGANDADLEVTDSSDEEEENSYDDDSSTSDDEIRSTKVTLAKRRVKCRAW